MNVEKTLETVVVWYDDTGKVSLAKCRATGKFVSLAIAQGLLNVELNTFRLPCTSTVKVNYSLLAMLLACLAVLVGLPIGLIVAKIAGCDSVVIANIGLVKAAFVAWFLSIVILASVGNK